MNNILSKVKEYLILIICGFISVISLVIIIPGIQSIFSTREEMTAKERTRDLYDQKIDILSSQNLPGIKKDLINSLLALPSSYDSPSLLNALEKIATASGVSISGLQFSQPSTAGGGEAVTTATKNTFALSTNSDYAHIIALFRNFENTLPLFTIENIGLRSGGEGSADLSLSFGISSYYQSLPTTLGDKTTPVADLAVSQKELLTALEGYSNYPLVPDTSGVGKTNPFK
ncbi:hypothetical protein A2X44_02010 [candidate division CPR3 bacterium GWF2_35_18]|uniref:Uncharacterized protein n=1 Tax=candidate division CPR3 bacterium GW2011_GWF2_35_18 TaxID=1618350 RepID=A0A0G0C1K2_UNCC3|nr:MAG: hypothetical protein UR67_C0002G0086 [candidate division CPR3 bacterium GW2011_GWF2_35_18]KKP86385.1 MAG: hypothetical protein UR87_C0021G0014 [candidate division CPR3 bacterium GW2011_GWE2_35_7]OGB62774.1 MAG: hypothetical protein A2X44_02010 [candidate division CPR3 bacterium GWF2_35_18]OGB65355.1 MAG: hypothetical protein A2250_00225 [candidate division CPR3 bacterium RIFOXYA2_FULL_35_13]OGB77031.1 MAG: hypothetical protein A2476_01100 [candidate division CPR3 bacterium RIFOXYC2_FULL